MDDERFVESRADDYERFEEAVLGDGDAADESLGDDDDDDSDGPNEYQDDGFAVPDDDDDTSYEEEEADDAVYSEAVACRELLRQQLFMSFDTPVHIDGIPFDRWQHSEASSKTGFHRLGQYIDTFLATLHAEVVATPAAADSLALLNALPPNTLLKVGSRYTFDSFTIEPYPRRSFSYMFDDVDTRMLLAVQTLVRTKLEARIFVVATSDCVRGRRSALDRSIEFLDDGSAVDTFMESITAARAVLSSAVPQQSS